MLSILLSVLCPEKHLCKVYVTDEKTGQDSNMFKAHKKSKISECSSLNQYASEMSVFHLNIIFTYKSHTPVHITIHTTLWRSKELFQEIL